MTANPRSTSQVRWKTPVSGSLAGIQVACFASLYALQGVVYAYVATYSTLHLRAAGVPLQTAGTVESIILLPFALKFLIGPVSDRFNLLGYGHRIPYLILGCTVQSLGLIALAQIDPGSALGAYLLFALVAVIGFAIYDTCGDGMLVETVAPEQRDRIQGLLIFSRFAMAALCSVGFGWWLQGQVDPDNPSARIDLTRMPQVLYFGAALALIPLALITRLREPSEQERARSFSWSAFAVMVRPRSLLLLGYASLYAIASVPAIFGLSEFHQFGLGLTVSEVGWLGSAKDLGRALGAFSLVLLARWIPRRWLLVLSLSGLAAIQIGQSIAGGLASVLGLALGLGALVGLLDALFYVLAMECSSRKLSASTFALFMAVSNLGSLGMPIFAGAVGNLEQIPPGPEAVANYHRGFTTLALLTVTCLPLAWLLSSPRWTQADSQEPETPPRPETLSPSDSRSEPDL